MRRWTSRLIVLVLLVVLTSALSIAVIRIWTYASVREFLYASAGDVPPRDVAIVLASGARRSGPSTAAVKRLNAAIDLLQAGRVKTVLVSGQDFEVNSMRQYLVRGGIESITIAVDGDSQRTFDSCGYVKRTYPAQRVVFVSQAEHVARAVYTCRELGVDAVGLIAPDFDGVPFLTYRLHELIALPIAWWDVYVAAPE